MSSLIFYQMARLIVMKGHEKGITYDEIGLCIKHSAFIVNSCREVYVIIRRETIFILTSCNVCISTLSSKLELTTYVICEC